MIFIRNSNILLLFLDLVLIISIYIYICKQLRLLFFLFGGDLVQAFVFVSKGASKLSITIMAERTSRRLMYKHIGHRTFGCLLAIFYGENLFLNGGGGPV